MSRSAAMARIRDIDTREYQAGVEGAGRYARSWGGGSLGPSAAAMDALGRTIWASQLAMLTRAEGGGGGESSDEEDMLAALQGTMARHGGEAVDAEFPGTLLIETDDGTRRVHAGDCEHLRPV